MSDDDPDDDTTEQVGETATRWQTSIEVPDELVDWIAEQAHAIEQLTNTRLDLYDSEVGNTRQRLRIAGTNISTVEVDRVGWRTAPSDADSFILVFVTNLTTYCSHPRCTHDVHPTTTPWTTTSAWPTLFLPLRQHSHRLGPPQTSSGTP